MALADDTPPGDRPAPPPPVQAELPARERGWPLAVWLLVGAIALVVSLIALDAALSWF